MPASLTATTMLTRSRRAGTLLSRSPTITLGSVLRQLLGYFEVPLGRKPVFLRKGGTRTASIGIVDWYQICQKVNVVRKQLRQEVSKQRSASWNSSSKDSRQIAHGHYVKSRSILSEASDLLILGIRSEHTRITSFPPGPAKYVE